MPKLQNPSLNFTWFYVIIRGLSGAKKTAPGFGRNWGNGEKGNELGQKKASNIVSLFLLALQINFVNLTCFPRDRFIEHFFLRFFNSALDFEKKIKSGYYTTYFEMLWKILHTWIHVVLRGLRDPWESYFTCSFVILRDLTCYVRMAIPEYDKVLDQ